jgi:hypothetical protein
MAHPLSFLWFANEIGAFHQNPLGDYPGLVSDFSYASFSVYGFRHLPHRFAIALQTGSLVPGG